MGSLDETQAKTRVVRHYLKSLGPATEDDVCWWTGFTKTDVRAALNSIRSETTEIKIAGSDGRYIAYSSDMAALDSELRESNSVNFLPALDSYIMGYTDRQRFLGGGTREFVFDRSGNAAPTIVVDGIIAGVWDPHVQKDGVLKIVLFGEHTKAVLDRIVEGAKRAGTFVAEQEVSVKVCDSMVSLSRRTAGGFMSPLKR